MKKLIYIYSLVLAWIMASCTEGTDFDIEYTPIAPIGGQYVVTISYGYDENKTDAEFWMNPTNVQEQGQTYAFLSNTTDFDVDKAWIRVGSYSAKNSYNINTKISIDMKNYKFSGSAVDNFVGNSATAVDKVTVEGYCTHNEFVAPSGATTDYISFTYSRTDAPGYHFKAEGWKYTGWAEDDY
jgi:hypothetical protein